MLKHNMRVIEYQNASEFLAVANEHLLENEAVNAIILNYAHNQMQGIKSAMTTAFYCVAEGDKPLPPAMFTEGICPLFSQADRIDNHRESTPA